MSQLLDHNTAQKSWWHGLLRRISWSIKAFKAPSKQPVLHLGNGVMLNLEHGVVVIDGDFDVCATGNLRLRAEKHLILESGQNQEERPGYLHSIWLNPVYDDAGRPSEDPEIVEIEEFSHENDIPS